MRVALLIALCGMGCGQPALESSPSSSSSTGAALGQERSEEDVAPEAPRTAPSTRPPLLIALDTHVDTPQRMLDAQDDLAERLPDGHLDLPRMRDGGLSGAFFSIWVDPDEHPGERAWEHAHALIRSVRALTEAHPEQATLCRTAGEVRAAAAAGRAAILMGVEGGHALGAPESDDVLIERIGTFHELGVRYMTVTWSNDNRLAHSSGGAHPERGLTELGRRAILEMNRLGMIVDVSHVSDRTFWDILDVSQRPPLASHSSCRALADHPRNMTDDMIRALGERGGAVCINFYTQFIDREYGRRRRRFEREHRAELAPLREQFTHSWQRWRPVNEWVRQRATDLAPPGLDVLGAHFAHVVEIAGGGAACLGSDFDGVGELPSGLPDVAHLGALRSELERRGLPVPQIFGENVLRIMQAQLPGDGEPRDGERGT